MRRAMAVLVMVAAMVPAPAAAQSTSDEWDAHRATTDVLGAVSAMLDAGMTTEAIASTRAVIAADRDGLLDVVPQSCWTAVYVARAEMQALLAASLDLYEAGQHEAFALVFGKVFEPGVRWGSDVADCP